MRGDKGREDRGEGNRITGELEDGSERKSKVKEEINREERSLRRWREGRKIKRMRG